MHSASAECWPALVIPLRRVAEKVHVRHEPCLTVWNGPRWSLTAVRGLVLATSVAAVSTSAQAQVATDIERAPTLTIERYNEDWSYLANPAARKGHWTEPFKYISLGEDRSTYLTTGLEARSRYEGFTDVNRGTAPNDSYVWNRFMPYADLHVSDARLFAQPIVSSISGLERPPRPVDSTGADMLQAFAEMRLKVSETASLSMSGGRKLVTLGAGRFIDTRYGPNILQAFDGGDAAFSDKTRQITALYFRPVDYLPGDFDDRTSRHKAVWGVYATKWLTERRAIGFDLYYLGLRDDRAIYQQGAGAELVHTFGSRVFGDTSSWRWNIEGALQGGRFANYHRSGWGIGGEVGYRFQDAPLQPDVSLMADVISGDRNPNDQSLETFNPLFPRGKYFGALSPIGPRNLIHLRPTVTIKLHQDVTVSFTSAGYWRQSLDDGVYGLAGNLVRSAQGSKARFIGTQFELAVAWQATAELNLTASVSAFEAGSFIKDTGPAQIIKMLGLMANYRF